MGRNAELSTGNNLAFMIRSDCRGGTLVFRNGLEIPLNGTPGTLIAILNTFRDGENPVEDIVPNFLAKSVFEYRGYLTTASGEIPERSDVARIDGHYFTTPKEINSYLRMIL